MENIGEFKREIAPFFWMEVEESACGDKALILDLFRRAELD